MNHIDPNVNTSIDQASVNSVPKVDKNDGVQAQLGSEKEPVIASRQANQARRARFEKIGFGAFIGVFMIYLFVQAIFFPSGGTGST